jgi:hypothetical protein
MDHVLDHAKDGWLQSACADCGPILGLPTGAAVGQDMECPSSEDDFVLSFAPDSVDIEWTERSAGN